MTNFVPRGKLYVSVGLTPLPCIRDLQREGRFKKEGRSVRPFHRFNRGIRQGETIVTITSLLTRASSRARRAGAISRSTCVWSLATVPPGDKKPPWKSIRKSARRRLSDLSRLLHVRFRIAPVDIRAAGAGHC